MKNNQGGSHIPQGEGAAILQSLRRTEGKQAEQAIVDAPSLALELRKIREDLEAFKEREKAMDQELRAICLQLAEHLERKHKMPKREEIPDQSSGAPWKG